MNGRPDRTRLLEVQEFFNLPSPALVEKDWHVVQALAAISAVSTDGLTLVFGGGTALGRAYRLLSRMSEDIDPRVVGDKATSRGPLQRMRGAITGRLAAHGFKVEGNVIVRQSDRYVRYELPYAPIMVGEGVLGPRSRLRSRPSLSGGLRPFSL